MDIVIIGSGNLATQLAGALRDAGQKILQVFSRTEEHARELAGKIGCGYTADIDEICISTIIGSISILIT